MTNSTKSVFFIIYKRNQNAIENEEKIKSKIDMIMKKNMQTSISVIDFCHD